MIPQKKRTADFAGLAGAPPNSTPMLRGRPAIGPEAPRPASASSNSSMSRGRPAIGPEAPTKSTSSSLQSAPITYAQLANEARQLQSRSVNPLNPSEMWSAAQRNYDPGPQYKPNVTGGKYVGNAGQTPSSTFQTHRPINPQPTLPKSNATGRFNSWSMLSQSSTPYQGPQGYGDPGEDEAPRSRGRRGRGGSRGSSRNQSGGDEEDPYSTGKSWLDGAATANLRGALERTQAGREHLYGKASNAGSESGIGPFTRLFAAVKNGQIEGLGKDDNLRHLMGVSTQYSNAGAGPGSLKGKGDPYIERLNAAHQQYLARGQANQTAPAPSSSSGFVPSRVPGSSTPEIERMRAERLARSQASSSNSVPANVQTAWNQYMNPPAGTGGVKPTREMMALFDQYGLTNQPSQPSAASSSTNRNGYGAFLNLPPGSRVDRRFVDSDGDGIDDRYQSGPGQPRGGGTKPNVPVRPSPIRPTPPPAPTAPTPPPAIPNNPSSGINWRKRPRRNAN